MLILKSENGTSATVDDALNTAITGKRKKRPLVATLISGDTARDKKDKG